MVFLSTGEPQKSPTFCLQMTLLFCQATERKTQETLHVLKLYAEASGQCLNMEKSSVYFSSNTSSLKKGVDKGNVRGE